jgi:hypothetical protein
MSGRNATVLAGLYITVAKRRWVVNMEEGGVGSIIIHGVVHDSRLDNCVYVREK